MRFILLVVAFAAGIAFWVGARPAGPVEVEVVEVEVKDTVVRPQVRRFGLNLGLWTSWGAEQLSGNVLKNPGFEGVIDRAIVTVGYSGQDEFSDDTDWLGRPDDFWTGAAFEVRTGRSAGQSGRIAHSLFRGPGALPVYTTQAPAPLLDHGDVVSLTRINDRELPTQWWIPDASRCCISVSSEVRPGSPGVRSLALTPLAGTSPEFSSYLDAIGERAGKLLPITGEWRLAFWTRATRGKAELHVDFGRQGSPAFLSKTYEPDSKWHQVAWRFTATDEGPPGILQLRFQAATHAPTAELLIDDVELEREGDSDFRSEVVSTLEQMHPGYLRDWQGQLGDTLDNRVAGPFGRRSTRYRPEQDGTDYAYGLPEFLRLCQRIHANPWIVVPATFTDAESEALGKYLGTSDTPRFDEVLVEFGNENWNDVFRPAGIPAIAAHVEAATRCFSHIRAHAGPDVRLKTVVNAQSVNPVNAAQTARAARGEDMVAIAPYFLYSLDSGLAPHERLTRLFTRPPGGVAALASELGTGRSELAAYEVNLHTTGGNATGTERNAVVESAAAGAALARSMLEALRAGAIRQCAYAFAGYDAKLGQRADFVNLWGLVRDVAGPGHFRPTGTALMLLNQVVGGSLYATASSDKAISTYAFKRANGWSVAIINEADSERTISLRLPRTAGWPLVSLLLGDSGPRRLPMVAKESSLNLVAPPFSLVVLLQQGQGK